MYSRNRRINESFKMQGLICEMYIGLQMQIKDIAAHLKIDYREVSIAITRYFKKPPVTLELESRINKDENIDFIMDNWHRLTYDEISEKTNLSVHAIRHRAIKLNLGEKPQALRALK